MFGKMILALLLAILTACAGGGIGGYGPKTTTGAAAGGAAGGLIGSQLGGAAATAAGVLLGGLLGATVGQQMDSQDYYRMRSSLETSRTGQPTEWHNPDTGAHHQITPTRTYENQSGQPCREFNTTAEIGGRRQNIHGVACRESDGTWRVVE
jgi:surface antigen